MRLSPKYVENVDQTLIHLTYIWLKTRKERRPATKLVYRNVLLAAHGGRHTRQ